MDVILLFPAWREMSRQVAEVEIHAAEDDDDCIDINVDLIEDGLYLGKHYNTNLKYAKIMTNTFFIII